MGAGDIRERTVTAGQSQDAGELAEDIARLNKEWREKRDSFRNSKQGSEASTNLPTPEVNEAAGCEASEFAVTGSNCGLAEAAASGSLEACQRILSRLGAEAANAWSSDGTTPLCAAANWDNADVTRVLLEGKADPRQPNRSGPRPTALHVAALQENGKICMMLLGARADPHMKDGNGLTPSDHASCSEAVWPHFAANGCIRTTKEELIRKGVIRRASAALELELGVPVTNGDRAVSSRDPSPVPDGPVPDGPTTGGVLREFSRPGSAYVLMSKHPPRPGSAAAKSSPGPNSGSGRRPSGSPIDILAEGDEGAAEGETLDAIPSSGYGAGIPPLPPSIKTTSSNTAAPSSLRSLGL
jgi:ankyrin repeat protein